MELLEALEKQKQLLDAISSGEYCCLRHSLPYVTVSDLALQAYCEMRLHLALARGAVGEPRRRELRLLVEAVLKASKRVRGDCDNIALSIPVAGVVEGVPVVGRPDAILVRGGRVSAIVWAKVSKRLKPAMWDRVRLLALALVADYGGLPMTNPTHLVLVVGETPSAVKKGLQALIVGEDLVGSDYTIYQMVYDRLDALKWVAPLLAYWRGEREPRPRPSRGCSKCPYRDVCPAYMGADNATHRL